MAFSMTGYGRGENRQEQKQVSVELKSLNGKNFELVLKMPSQLKPFENDIRNLLTQSLVRGTVECRIEVKHEGVSKVLSLNEPLAESLYRQADQLRTRLGVAQADILSGILRLPEIFSSDAEAMEENDWSFIQSTIQASIDMLQSHRAQEGKMLAADLRQRIANIQQLHTSINSYEPLRRDRLRQRIEQSLQEVMSSDKIDSNRLEQELIYYTEKMDISEEQTRLTAHCEYFLEIMEAPGESKGKKLGFILQEIGREINTMGSKANDADMQKVVINMKDELEKAKEQILNLL